MLMVLIPLFTYSYFEELNESNGLKQNFAGRNKFGLVAIEKEKKSLSLKDTK